MAGVDRHIGIDEGFDFVVVRADKGNRRIPEHSVVDNQQIRAHMRGELDFPKSGVDGGCNQPDLPAVGALKTVFRAVVVVKVGGGEVFVHKCDDFVKFGGAFCLFHSIPF